MERGEKRRTREKRYREKRDGGRVRGEDRRRRYGGEREERETREMETGVVGGEESGRLNKRSCGLGLEVENRNPSLSPAFHCS